ncbi:MAG: hypothetical protein OEZ34_07995 [Spirochaetia bacterium]|nr:hypothetical protein [Spirochaetia bacterium]
MKYVFLLLIFVMFGCKTYSRDFISSFEVKNERGETPVLTHMKLILRPGTKKLSRYEIVKALSESGAEVVEEHIKGDRYIKIIETKQDLGGTSLLIPIFTMGLAPFLNKELSVYEVIYKNGKREGQFNYEVSSKAYYGLFSVIGMPFAKNHVDLNRDFIYHLMKHLKADGFYLDSGKNSPKTSLISSKAAGVVFQTKKDEIIVVPSKAGLLRPGMTVTTFSNGTHRIRVEKAFHTRVICKPLSGDSLQYYNQGVRVFTLK